MVHESWRDVVEAAMKELDPEYRDFLANDSSYFPDQNNFLNAFKTLPRHNTRMILFGQDPYPRKESAVGYAFIDGAVDAIFGENGFSKQVGRATSLRNFLKMLLVAHGYLQGCDTTKEEMARIDKRGLIETMDDLRINFEKQGVLLLNTALVFTSKDESRHHALMWRPFVRRLLEDLRGQDIELILFGKMAQQFGRHNMSAGYRVHEMEHPYNISFITNPKAHELFAPMGLLNKPLF